jgi:hypothetical protein
VAVRTADNTIEVWHRFFSQRPEPATKYRAGEGVAKTKRVQAHSAGPPTFSCPRNSGRGCPVERAAA